MIKANARQPVEFALWLASKLGADLSFPKSVIPQTVFIQTVGEGVALFGFPDIEWQWLK